jgi:tRNA threonylcarbamoyladenosine biosynthesis protein TsaB
MSTSSADGGPTSSWLLAIDTSSSQAGIALFDGRSLSSRSWPADRSHTTTLLCEIHRMLDGGGCEVSDLAAIALAMGPGAFTGLRVGFGVAKGFHLATGVPLIGVSTLEATALPYAVCGCPVVAVVAAGRGRIVWATYTATDTGLSESSLPRNGVVEELAGELQGRDRVIVTGELDDDQEAVLTALSNVVVPPAPLRNRLPGSLASLAWRRWRAGEVDDAVLLEPVYLSR